MRNADLNLDNTDFFLYTVFMIRKGETSMNVLFSFINKNVSGSTEHRHHCWELVYRISGGSDTTIGGQMHRVSAGDLYLIPPDVIHMDTSTELYSDLVIHVEYLDLSDVMVLHDYETYVSSLAQLINVTMNKKESNYKNISDSLMEALFQYIKRFSLSSKQNPLVHRLKNTIFENIENSDFDLTKEIKNMGYHPDYIRRCFKAETGKTPLYYLTDLRIERAKQLLVTSVYDSIETVSGKCGFDDSFYFSTCFKKHTGMSPFQYRKQNLSKY